MQKARRHPKNGAPTARRRTVSGSLSLRSQRCFSPFPHGTRPLSVSRECLALADGAAGFGQGSSDPALLRVLPGLANVPRTGPSPSAARLSRRLPLRSLRPYQAALQPRRRLDADGLGWPPFARRYSGGHSCFPLLRLLGCFGSPGSPPPNGGRRAHARRVAPFGNPRIKGSSRLPAACRSLPRPSSPPGATGIHRAPSLACRRGHGRATDGGPRRETPKAARLRRARRGDTAPRPPRDNARKPRSTNSLSQLSLPPPTRRAPARHDGVLPMPSMNPAPQRRGKVEDVGVEPTASGLQSRRSSQLSQSPGPVVPGGLEPPASTLSVWRSNRAELQDWTRPSGPRSKAGAACRGPAGSPRRGEGEARAKAAPPERRCSSRTFRYGYLVTT